MAEQPPAFVVVDKRKFTAEGERRDTFTEAEPTEPALSPNVVTMPPRTPEASEDATVSVSVSGDDLREEDMAGVLESTGTDGVEFDPGYEPTHVSEDELAELTDDGTAGAPIGAAETAELDAAYRQTSGELDAMLRQANPGMQQPGAVTFEHVIQSFYLSAIVAMGAGAEPGQKPRVDILGARQSIDMLGMLEEKTRGNLTPAEGELLRGIMFELRMMFMELTNAISRQALQGAPGTPKGPGSLR